MRLFVMVAMLAAVGLAGCSDGGESGDTGTSGPTKPDDTLTGKGFIVGVVVDPSITPVAAATVMLVGTEEQATTNEDGEFVFNNIEPGPYFIKVQKNAYKESQQSVTVVADDADPDVVKVLLEPDPENRAFYQEYVFEGFIECAAGGGGVGSANPCFVSDASVNVFNESLDAVPTFIQTEMVWEENSAFGEGLWYSHFVDGGSAVGPNDYLQIQGASPLVLRSPEDVHGPLGVGATEELQMRVFPADDQATVTANQEFRIFAHVFYNYEPPADWQFTKNGAPPDP